MYIGKEQKFVILFMGILLSVGAFLVPIIMAATGPTNAPTAVDGPLINAAELVGGFDVEVTFGSSGAKSVDTDIGLALVAFAPYEMHNDTAALTPLVFDLGEAIYNDTDNDNFISAGDTRLANPPFPFTVGSVVGASDSDWGPILVGFTANEKHEDSIVGVPTALDAGETVYDDVPVVGVVSAGDTRLANAATQGFSDGSVVTGADTLELLLGGGSFVPPLSTVLTAADIAADQFTFTVSSTQIGPDGPKSITATVTGGGPSGALSLTLDTIIGTPGNPSVTEATDGYINIVENSDGYAVTVDVSDTAFAGADTVQLLDNNTPFGSSQAVSSAVGGVLTFNIASGGLAEGSHTITARATDAAANTQDSAGGATFIVDLTAPASSLAINGNTFPDRTFSTLVSLETTCDDGPIGSGCATFVVGGSGIEITNQTVGLSEPFVVSRPAILTQGRDIAKSAVITSVTDFAGNTAAGPFPDSIALDARILTVLPSTTTPYWNVTLNIDGTVENALPSDRVRVDFGSPTVIDPTIVAGIYDVTGQYPQISLDSDSNPHTPNATLTDASDADVFDSTSTRVSTLGPLVTVQRHPTELQVDEIEAAGTTKPVIVKGILDDTLTGFGFPNGVPVSVVGTNGEGFVASVTGGVTIEDNAGLEIDTCGDCSPSTNIAMFNEGTGEIRIETIPSPTSVRLVMADNGATNKDVVFEITSGPTDIGPPEIALQTVTLLGGEGISASFQNAWGVSKIRIVDVSDDSKLGVSEISSSETNGVVIHSVEFSGLTPTTTTDPITFDDGTFFSKGTAPSTVGDFIATIDSGNTDYAPPTGVTRTYLTVESLGAGSGGATNTVLDLSGFLITARSCTGSGGDSDGDGICNDWESLGGVPFTVTTGVTPVVSSPIVYDLEPNPTSNRDLYYEIDYMTGHTPIAAALTGVASVFSSISSPINFNYDLDDVIPHHPASPAQQWIDSFADTDTIDDDDFNSLKNNLYGDISERSTISSQALQVVDSTFPALGSSATSGDYRVNVTGITVLTTPNHLTYGDDTSGTIDIKFKVNCGVSCTVTTISTPSVNSISGINVRTPTASVSTDSASIKVVTIQVPYWTTTAIGGSNPVGVLGNVGVHIHVVNSAAANINTLTDAAFTTKAGSPAIGSTLMDAKAQVVRYMMFVHNTTGASGQGEIIGNDIIISLTGFGGDSDGFGGSQGTLEQQKGTILHEIGHNLGLKHGGPKYFAANINQPVGSNADYNCKPNYPSIMSYSRQLPSYFGESNWNTFNILNFSDGGLTRMNETALNETVTAGPVVTNTDTTFPRVLWGSPLNVHGGTDHVSHFDIVNASSNQYDWDDDGIRETTKQSANVNHFNIRECDNNSPIIRKEIYNDYNDWGNLWFDFRTLSTTFDGSDPDTKVNAQATIDNAASDTLPPGKTHGSATAGSSVPFKVRYVTSTNPPVSITTLTPDPYSGYIEISKTCKAPYTTIPGVFQWEDSTKHLKLVYKSSKADKGKTYCFKAHITTLNRDEVVFDEIAPNNTPLFDNSPIPQRITWRILFG